MGEKRGMRILSTAVLGVSLLLGLSVAAESTGLKDEKDRISYSIGYNLASDLKRQGVEVNRETLLKGIEDALAGSEPLIPRKEINETLADLKKSIAAARREKQEKAAEKNLAEGDAFLAANAGKEGVRTLPSGLQFKVIRDGTGKSPNDDDTVTVSYRGTLINGNEFDNSQKRNKPATVRVDRVIPGWAQALKMMKEGAKWQIFVPAKLAYGKRGAGPGIPPGSALIFDLELLSVVAGPAPGAPNESPAASKPPGQAPAGNALPK